MGRGSVECSADGRRFGFRAPGGSAELQLDYANFVRIAGDTEIRISALENGRNQIQMAKGLITCRVLRDTNVQSEISTPAVAVHPLRQTAVRVEVAPDGAPESSFARATWKFPPPAAPSASTKAT